MTTKRHKIGQNRGRARIWLQGNALKEHGWIKGRPWLLAWGDNQMLCLADHDDSNRKVAGDATRPVIDINTKKITELFPDATHVVVEITDKQITINAEEN